MVRPPRAPTDGKVLRLASDGSTDSGFGGCGGVTVDAGGHDVVTSIALQPDGKLVVAGFGVGAAGHGQTIVRRYLADGSADPGFTPYHEAFGVNDTPVGIVAQGSGTTVVAANSKVGTDNDVVLLRLADDGTPDADFGIDGATVSDVGRRSVARRRGRAVGGSSARGGQHRVGARDVASAVPVPGRRLGRTDADRGSRARRLRRPVRVERELPGAPTAVVGNPYWPGLGHRPRRRGAARGRVAWWSTGTAASTGSRSTTARAHAGRARHAVLARLGHRPRRRGAAGRHRRLRRSTGTAACTRSRSAAARCRRRWPARRTGAGSTSPAGSRSSPTGAVATWSTSGVGSTASVARRRPTPAVRPGRARTWSAASCSRPTAAAVGCSTARAGCTRSAPVATRRRRRRSAVRTGRAPPSSPRRSPRRRAVACRGGDAAQRPAHHRRPVARRLPRRGRSSGGADAEPRPARGRGRAVPAPLRAGRAVRAEPRVVAHRHVPDEPPVGAERHAARRALHEPRARGARRRATTPCCSATPTRRPIRARSRPTTRGSLLRRRAARLPRGRRPPGAPRRVGRVVARRRATTFPTTCARCTSRCRTRPARRWPTPPSTPRPRSSPARCSTTSTTRTRALVRARRVHPAAPAVRRARAVRIDVRPGRRPRTRARRDATRRRARCIRCSPVPWPSPGIRLGDDRDELRQMRATYYGMMTEVDAQIGRLFDGLARRGVWDDTLVVLTSDHGEQLGDHWLTEKLGWFEQSYHVPLHRARPVARRRARGASSTTLHRERRRDADDARVARRRRAGAVRRPVVARARARRRRRPWRDAAFWEWDFRDPTADGRRRCSASRSTSARSRCCATSTASTCTSRACRRSSTTSTPIPHELVEPRRRPDVRGDGARLRAAHAVVADGARGADADRACW